MCDVPTRTHTTPHASEHSHQARRLQVTRAASMRCDVPGQRLRPWILAR